MASFIYCYVIGVFISVWPSMEDANLANAKIDKFKILILFYYYPNMI